jgi:hypothetical protein
MRRGPRRAGITGQCYSLTIGFLHESFALSVSHLFNAPVQNSRKDHQEGTSQMARRQTNSCLIDRLLLCFNRFWNE